MPCPHSPWHRLHGHPLSFIIALPLPILLSKQSRCIIVNARNVQISIFADTLNGAYGLIWSWGRFVPEG